MKNRDKRGLSVRETDAFDLGWDHGVYHVAPDPSLPVAVRQGYLAAREARQPLQADRFVLKWLQIRTRAMLRGVYFDSAITPETLKALDVQQCPISAVSLSYGERGDSDWSVDRVLNQYGYRPGNLMIVSTRVNRIKGALQLNQIRSIAVGDQDYGGLSSLEWMKLSDVVEMFHSAEQGDPPMGLPKLDGRTPTNGLRLSALAFWQLSLTIAVWDKDAWLLRNVCSNVPSTKAVRRAVQDVIKVMAPRIAKLTEAELFTVWSSSRLQKRLTELVELLPKRWHETQRELSQCFFSSRLALADSRERLRGSKGGAIRA